MYERRPVGCLKKKKLRPDWKLALRESCCLMPLIYLVLCWRQFLCVVAEKCSDVEKPSLYSLKFLFIDCRFFLVYTSRVFLLRLATLPILSLFSSFFLFDCMQAWLHNSFLKILNRTTFSLQDTFSPKTNLNWKGISMWWQLHYHNTRVCLLFHEYSL